MIFLPASFAAVRFHYPTSLFIDTILLQTIFRMNVVEINPQGGTNLFQFVALILPLVVVTFWIFFTFQTRHLFPVGTSFYKRLGWPIIVVIDIHRKRSRR